MPAIKISDLNNAKVDTDFIAEFATSESETAIDRMGRERRTLAGVEAYISEHGILGDSLAAQAGAEAAEAGAEAARDAALVQAGVYVDEPTGRAAVADGEAFKVQGSGEIAAWEYRRVDSASSTLLTAYASDAFIRKVRSDLTKGGLANFVGAGEILPIVTDQDGRILIGINSTTGALLANIDAQVSEVVTRSLNLSLSQELSFSQFTGSGTVLPLATDQNGVVLLGIDSTTGKIVGDLDSGKTMAARGILQPLVGLDLTPEASILHSLGYGQSLSVGSRGTPPISTVQPYLNLTFLNGPRSTGRVGTLGGLTGTAPCVENELVGDGGSDQGETHCSAAANQAVRLAAKENGVDWATGPATLASTAGHGSYSIAMLSPGELVGGVEWWKNWEDHIQAGHDLALAAGKTYAASDFVWIQGEANAQHLGGATLGTFAYYLEKLTALRAAMQARYQDITGQTNRPAWLSYQTTWGVANNKNIALAQAAYCADPANHAYLVTPCYHLPFADDNIHLTRVGSYLLGHYMGRARKTLIYDKAKPQSIVPVGATYDGVRVELRCKVPVLPLVLDTTSLAPTTAYGFTVIDGVGSVPLTDAAVSASGDGVIFTLGRAISGAATLRYALDNLAPGLNINGAASGNLRDSEWETTTVGGVTYPLYNVAPHFELSIINI